MDYWLRAFCEVLARLDIYEGSPVFNALLLEKHPDEGKVFVEEDLERATQWIVLEALPEHYCGGYPLFIKKKISAASYPEPRLSTVEVAGFFRARLLEELGKAGTSFPEEWAPQGRGWDRLQGDLPPYEAATSRGVDDCHSYLWYDLSTMDLGRRVYLVADSTLWLFTKEKGEKWALNLIPNLEWVPTPDRGGVRSFGWLFYNSIEVRRLQEEPRWR